MWNSGVVGVPAGDRALVDQALELYEDMGAAGVRHFATEQLVEWLVLGRTGRLHAAEPLVHALLGQQAGYDAEIARRLADAFIEGLSVKEAAARYRERPIDLPVELRRTRTEKLRRRWIRPRRALKSRPLRLRGTEAASASGRCPRRARRPTRSR